MLQILLITFILILVPIASKAQNVMFGGELVVSAELTSDYRFRGVSKSDNNILFSFKTILFTFKLE